MKFPKRFFALMLLVISVLYSLTESRLVFAQSISEIRMYYYKSEGCPACTVLDNLIRTRVVNTTGVRVIYPSGNPSSGYVPEVAVKTFEGGTEQAIGAPIVGANARAINDALDLARARLGR